MYFLVLIREDYYLYSGMSELTLENQERGIRLLKAMKEMRCDDGVIHTSAISGDGY